MRNIYIVNRGFHDYTRTQRFLKDGGRVIAITNGNIDLQATDRLEERIQYSLRDATGSDILLLGGAPIIGALAQAYMHHRFGKVHVLFFDPGTRDYILRTISGEEKRVLAGDGTIVCPTCERVVAEAPPGIRAVAEAPCELCKAEGEEELLETEDFTPPQRRVL